MPKIALESTNSKKASSAIYFNLNANLPPKKCQIKHILSNMKE